MADSDLLSFTPVPLRSRRDGWTAERQRAFIASLAKGLQPGTAARLVGMGRRSAYGLRARPGGEGFTAAWDAAVAAARRRRLEARAPSLWQRAVEGELRPIRYRGRIVCHDRRYDNAALARLFGIADRYLAKRGIEGGD
jgi:hypothetical protein